MWWFFCLGDSYFSVKFIRIYINIVFFLIKVIFEVRIEKYLDLIIWEGWGDEKEILGL